MDKLVIFLYVVLFVLAVILIVNIIKSVCDAKKNPVKPVSDEELFAPQYKKTEVMATVIGQSCCARVIGTKTPKAVREFTVVFRTENGEIIQLNVPEELYDGFDEGQTGMLTVVDNELYSFVPG